MCSNNQIIGDGMSKSMVVSKKITVAKYLDKLSLDEHLVLLRRLTELIVEEEENNENKRDSRSYEMHLLRAG